MVQWREVGVIQHAGAMGVPNSKYVIMFIHLKKKLYMQLLTGS